MCIIYLHQWKLLQIGWLKDEQVIACCLQQVDTDFIIHIHTRLQHKIIISFIFDNL